MKLLIYIFCAYGITNIAVFGHMFKSWRNYCNKISPNFLGKLFSCPMCLGFWVGVVLSTVFIIDHSIQLSPFLSNGVNSIYLGIFLDGCLASGSIWVLHNLEEMFERVNKVE